MSDSDIFDAIIIGAGPAGSACAYALAKAGKSVLLIERGQYAGSKNMTGGRIYTYALEMLEPGLHARAPLERKVTKEQIMLLGSTDAITVDFYNPQFGEHCPNSYTVLRGAFDQWLAEQAEEQGAMIAAGIRVDGLVTENGRITGVQAEDDILQAKVVIAADGVNSIMARQAGLRGELSPHSVGIGIKEVISLPAETINERFGVPSDQGVARVLVGCTQGIAGGGFLYTNKDTISLGAVFSPAQAADRQISVCQLMQDLKLHPALHELLKGGETVEYSAHLVNETGWQSVPKKLYCNGLMVIGDAAGFVVNTGTVIRGMDLAILSGIAAANAVLTGSDPALAGPCYMQELNRLGLIPTMQRLANWPDVLNNPRMFGAYPKMAADIMKSMFTVDNKAPQKLSSSIFQIVRQHVSLADLAADLWKGAKL